MMQKALFTSSSKTRILLWVVTFLTLFTLIVKLLNFVYVQEERWPKNVWHSFYSQESIDTVFLGSSHVFYDVIPQKMDEYTGENNFNLCTANQRLQESYFDLLEANRLYDIKKVYLEVYYRPSTTIEGVYSSDSAIMNSWNATDHMSVFSPVRYYAMIKMNDLNHALDALFPFVRFRSSLFDVGSMDYNIDSKTDEFSRNHNFYYEFDDGNGSYEHIDKGYFKIDRVADESERITITKTAEYMHLTDDAERYLQKIIDYCKNRDIEITLFITPTSQVQLMGVEDYDSYIDSVKSVADRNDINFYDFNLCKLDYFDLSSSEYWSDYQHMNTKGAEIFTQKMHEVVSGQVDFSSISHKTFAEKIESMEPQFFGVYYKKIPVATDYIKYLQETEKKSIKNRIKSGFFAKNDIINEDEEHRFLCFASNSDIFEYQVLFKSVDEETGEETETLIKDFNDDSLVEVEKDTEIKVVVNWREKGNNSDIKTREFSN